MSFRYFNREKEALSAVFLDDDQDEDGETVE
jgi:hypothetical protein